MGLLGYDVEDLGRGLRNPSLALHEVRRQVRATSTAVNNVWYRHRTDEAFDLADEDWDVVILLDGCRYDLFAETNWLEGDLEPRVSPASESWGFMQSTFAGRTFHDTVYVTANPHWYELAEGTFHHVVDLLTTDWNEEYGTVLPESVVERTLAARERFPDKRLIVHFMQPHFPFVGERGRKLDHKGLTLHLDDTDTDEVQVWSALERGRLSRDAVAAAYAENLELALPHVETLLTELPGKTVVTSDHGNLLGDRLFPIPVRRYGHLPDVRAPELVTVPWLTVPGERLSVTSEPPTADEHSAEHAEERLEALGYR